MNNKVPIFLRAAEIAEILGISQPAAYRIIRDLNTELQQKGYQMEQIERGA